MNIHYVNHLGIPLLFAQELLGIGLVQLARSPVFLDKLTFSVKICWLWIFDYIKIKIPLFPSFGCYLYSLRVLFYIKKFGAIHL